jgi:acyl-CoA synthetase (AMP-forming)/AMP-acid ligase II/aryl carrier-like protein
MLCSPNFGYRHYLKALGTRTPGDIDLSAVRLIFNGAEPISAELCDEFLTRLAPTGLKRTSMFPVYGLAEGSLAVSFPPPGTPARTVRFDRHGLRLNSAARLAEPGSRNALTLMSVGRAVPACELRIVDDADIALPERHVGHIQIRGDNVTRGYFEEPQANAAAFTGDGWLRTGDLGLTLDGDLFIAGRHKEILFVNGQNYYPHDLERMAEGIPGLELGKLVVAGARATGADGERLVAFVLHRGELGEFLPLARQLVRTLSTQAGLELDAVVPVRRIPKTTSGKIQRHLLEQEYEDGAFDAQLAELERLGGTHPASAQLEGAIEQQLQTLCESELDGRRIDPEESLFDLGASSLKLISIHERIEQRWPGAVEMTDIFENPTIRALSGFIESKIVAHP